MFEGKVNAAMKLLDQHDTGVVTLSQSTINEMNADPSILIDGQLPFVDTSTIMKSALR